MAGDEDNASFAYDYCASLVREGDPDRYFANLFAPADKRPHLFALHAFSLEIARVRDAVSTALPGEVRYQWWRDAIQGEARGSVRSNPVAAALDDTVTRFRLPRAALVSLIDARTFDLYDDPMPSLNDLEGYCGETASALIRLAALVLADGADPGGTDAAGHAGVAQGLMGVLRGFALHASRGQVFLPKDILDRNGVTREDIVTGRGGPGLDATLAELRAIVRGHLTRARAASGDLPPAIVPAFLPTSLVESYLKRMEARGYDPYRTVVEIPQWRRQWTLWQAARRRSGPA